MGLGAAPKGWGTWRKLRRGDTIEVGSRGLAGWMGWSEDTGEEGRGGPEDGAGPALGVSGMRWMVEGWDGDFI